MSTPSNHLIHDFELPLPSIETPRGAIGLKMVSPDAFETPLGEQAASFLRAHLLDGGNTQASHFSGRYARGELYVIAEHGGELVGMSGIRNWPLTPTQQVIDSIGPAKVRAISLGTYLLHRNVVHPDWRGLRLAEHMTRERIVRGVPIIGAAIACDPEKAIWGDDSKWLEQPYMMTSAQLGDELSEAIKTPTVYVETLHPYLANLIARVMMENNYQVAGLPHAVAEMFLSPRIRGYVYHGKTEQDLVVHVEARTPATENFCNSDILVAHNSKTLFESGFASTNDLRQAAEMLKQELQSIAVTKDDNSGLFDILELRNASVDQLYSLIAATIGSLPEAARKGDPFPLQVKQIRLVGTKVSVS